MTGKDNSVNSTCNNLMADYDITTSNYVLEKLYLNCWTRPCTILQTKSISIRHIDTKQLTTPFQHDLNHEIKIQQSLIN